MWVEVIYFFRLSRVPALGSDAMIEQCDCLRSLRRAYICNIKCVSISLANAINYTSFYLRISNELLKSSLFMCMISIRAGALCWQLNPHNFRFFLLIAFFWHGNDKSTKQKSIHAIWSRYKRHNHTRHKQTSERCAANAFDNKILEEIQVHRFDETKVWKRKNWFVESNRNVFDVV